MKPDFISNDVITSLEIKEIDKMRTNTNQMIKVIDIIHSSLNSKLTTKFKGFLKTMKESDDSTLQKIAKTLGK